jgi:hypothetical protein
VPGHKLIPVSWTDLVRRLKTFGFDGPFHGGKHPYMIRGELVLAIPNPKSIRDKRGSPCEDSPAGWYLPGRLDSFLSEKFFRMNFFICLSSSSGLFSN